VQVAVDLLVELDSLGQQEEGADAPGTERVYEKPVSPYNST
jgi:hypothetical protein